jgi:glycosyltransferase involved in cell wall biosynthesis
MDNLVSILIPAYNAERWIRETIESAISQTWQKKEIIVVDDGSTDKTLQIIKGYQSKCVKVIAQGNMGGPAARNVALKYAQGDFIQWLDHDDILSPYKIFRQIGNSDYDGNTTTLLSGTFGTFYFRIENAKFKTNSLYKNLKPIEYFLIKFNENAWLHPSVWLVSRKLTELAGPWCELKSPDDDGEYFCRIVAACSQIRFVSEAQSYWRISNLNSMSRNRSDESLEALFISTAKSINHLKLLEDSERTRIASLKFIQLSLSNFNLEKTEVFKKVNALANDLGGIISRNESTKFIFIKKMIGWRMANKIKVILWNIEVLIRGSCDRLLYIILSKK